MQSLSISKIATCCVCFPLCTLPKSTVWKAGGFACHFCKVTQHIQIRVCTVYMYVCLYNVSTSESWSTGGDSLSTAGNLERKHIPIECTCVSWQQCQMCTLISLLVLLQQVWALVWEGKTHIINSCSGWINDWQTNLQFFQNLYLALGQWSSLSIVPPPVNELLQVWECSDHKATHSLESVTWSGQWQALISYC